jgi:hypothetical protein
MFIEYWDKYWDEFIVVDHTEDEDFCHLGERDEEAQEAELRHNEYNNFLTSIMEDAYRKMSR